MREIPDSDTVGGRAKDSGIVSEKGAKTLKITYIAHSGFLVEWEHSVWLFDYYKGEIPVFSREKKLLVFVSHSHEDHFNPEIFQKFAEYPDVEYILASEIRHKVRKLALSEEQTGKIVFLKPRQSWELTDRTGQKILVWTYRSTDRGVAFLVEYKGKKVYHAGDLHWWVWKEYSKQRNNNMTANYQREIQFLKEEAGRIDAAFLPLDPRQEEWYRLGMDYFLEQIDVETAVPMHFWGDHSVIGRYKSEAGIVGKKVEDIPREGYEILLE